MQINLPILTIAALTNGLNPCGIGMMITFLGYLLVFGGDKGKKKNLARIGAVYIVSVFVTYLVTGLLFYGMAYYLQRLWFAAIFKYIMGGGIIVAGLIQLKDVFWQDLPLHLAMPKVAFKKLNSLMAKADLGVTIIIGVLATIFSTPCMLPLYVGTTAVLARSGLPMASVLGYFIYYNLIFILPLIGIYSVMVGGKKVVEVKEWEHENTKWMRFLLGVALIVVGSVIIIK